MKQISKYLLMMLFTTLCLGFSACGDDDDNPDISTSGKLNTVLAAAGEKITLDVGCQCYISGGVWMSSHSYIEYAGDFQDLSSVTTAPLKINFNTADFHDGGCYVVESVTGKYIRMKIRKKGETKYEFTFQTYIPTNI